MHGVHPAANAIPRGNAHAGPGPTRSWSRNGRPPAYSHARPTRNAYSSMKAPKAKTSTPAARWPAGDVIQPPNSARREAEHDGEHHA